MTMRYPTMITLKMSDFNVRPILKKYYMTNQQEIWKWEKNVVILINFCVVSFEEARSWLSKWGDNNSFVNLLCSDGGAGLQASLTTHSITSNVHKNSVSILTHPIQFTIWDFFLKHLD